MSAALPNRVFFVKKVGTEAAMRVRDFILAIAPANKRGAPGLTFRQATIAQIGFYHFAIIMAGELPDADLRVVGFYNAYPCIVLLRKTSAAI